MVKRCQKEANATKGPMTTDLLFVQGNGKVAAPKSEIECWHCSKKGHYKNKCPELQVLDVGIQNLLVNNKFELDMGVQILHIDEPN